MRRHYFDAPPDFGWSEVFLNMPLGATGGDGSSIDASAVIVWSIADWFGSVMVWLMTDWLGSAMDKSTYDWWGC